MASTDWLVIVIAAAAIAWVNWYFFFAERQSAKAKSTAAGPQEIPITVRRQSDREATDKNDSRPGAGPT